MLNGQKNLKINQQLKKKFIYLISPPEIKDQDFFDKLRKLLRLNKISFFQLRVNKFEKKKIRSPELKSQENVSFSQGFFKVLVADITLSLDNVLAVAGATTNISARRANATCSIVSSINRSFIWGRCAGKKRIIT